MDYRVGVRLTELAQAQAEHIEMMACKLVTDHGVEAVLDYRLVQTTSEDGRKVTWHYEKLVEGDTLTDIMNKLEKEASKWW